MQPAAPCDPAVSLQRGQGDLNEMRRGNASSLETEEPFERRAAHSEHGTAESFLPVVLGAAPDPISSLSP